MQNNGYEKYGAFSGDGREFIITRPDTPRPWINYAWSDHLLVSIDQRGSGNALYRDDDGNRSVAISDRFIYLKDLDSGEVWTVGWGAIRLPFSAYNCRHGLGYTVLSCDHLDWHAEWTITATADSVEVWKLTVVNRAGRARRLAVYPGVAFELGGWVPYGTLENYSCTQRLSSRLIYAANRSNERPGVRNDGFFATSLPADHYESSKRELLGGCYGSWSAPTAIINGHLGDHDAMNEEMTGTFEYELKLAAGENWSVYCAVSSCFDRKNAEQLATSAGAASFNDALAYARQRTTCFDRLDFELPDREWSRFFNLWAKQQLMLLKDYARVFLIGFRDSLQDAAAIAAYAPQQAAASIKRTLAYQFADGSALRGWCPIDNHKYADSGVWLAMAVAEYLRETADYAFLEEKQGYFDGGSGTVWEHLVRSLDWFEANLGSHGLPRLYFGDWNDSLNIGRGGKGESVWLAMALVVAYVDAAAIAGHCGKTDEQKKFERCAASMRRTIETVAWDGQWYLRGFTDDGNPVGSHSCTAGTIFSEPQSWAVMAGLEPSRLERLALAVDSKLRTPNGLVVCNPPFTEYDPAYGRISCMLPGWGENGSCYCHVTAFQAVADAMRRDGESAFRSLHSILPFHPELPVEVSRLEPYAFSNMFRGPGNLRSGETFKGWTSGTVPWALRALTHYILGVRPDFDALIVDPVLPSEWDNIRFHRSFRGAELEIVILNPQHLDSRQGKTRLSLDGNFLESMRIPVAMLTPGPHALRVEVVAHESLR